MKKILITGATGGIGKAIALRMCQENYALFLVARDISKLEKLNKELKTLYPNLIIGYTSCDVSNPENVKTLIEKIKKQNDEITALINSAGISGGGITSEITDEFWLKIINTNLNGVFFITRELLKSGLMSAGGRIVNIASTGGKQGVIYGAPYCASKHGVVGFTKALGLELAKNNSGITVNAVCPGFVETEMAEEVRTYYSKIWNVTKSEVKRRIEERVPIGRYIDPDEVAAMVAYIISPQAQGVTAQAINVCGGLGNY